MKPKAMVNTDGLSNEIVPEASVGESEEQCTRATLSIASV